MLLQKTTTTLKILSIGFYSYSVQKTLRGCATNICSKSSLLVYEWPLIKCKIWYMNGPIFKNFLKFEPKYWKNLMICSKVAPKLHQLVYGWVTFKWKIGICMGLLSNSMASCLYQSETWIPPQYSPAYHFLICPVHYLFMFVAYVIVPGGKVSGVNVLFTATVILLCCPYFSPDVMSASNGKCPPSWVTTCCEFNHWNYKTSLHTYMYMYSGVFFITL